MTKKLTSLTYFFKETDELIQARDYIEMEIASKRAEKIIAKLSDLVAQTEEMKLDHGASSRSVRQWKKDIKSRYSALLDERSKLVNASRNKQEELNRDQTMQGRIEAGTTNRRRAAIEGASGKKDEHERHVAGKT